MLKANIISQRCSNMATTLYNIATMLENYIILQHYHNIVTTLKTMLSHNVQATLSEHVCGCWCPTTTFRQHCHNIEATLKNYVIFNIATTLSQCCKNIVEHCVNIVDWPKYQHCTNIGKLCNVQCCHNIVTTLQAHTKNHKFNLSF